MTKKRYIIHIEIEADYIPSDVMDELCEVMAVQAESLTDGTLESTDNSLPGEPPNHYAYPYNRVDNHWRVVREE